VFRESLEPPGSREPADWCHLIPAEELALLRDAAAEALALAQAEQQEPGRQRLLHGLRAARAWQGEVWGPALIRYWLWALRQYDAQTR
jgi:hypothetical protein